MRVEGSLLGAFIQNAAKTAVVVIDEDHTSSGANDVGGALTPAQNATARQQRVIAVAQRFTCPVFLVQFSHTGLNAAGISLGNSAFDATRSHLRGLLPHNTPIVTKHYPNAFRDTGFHDYLQQNHPHVNRLLLAGFHANACVADTAGIWDFFANMDPGATHLGYTVMSCDGVLHGGPAAWADDAGQSCRQKVEFYATL